MVDQFLTIRGSASHRNKLATWQDQSRELDDSAVEFCIPIGQKVGVDLIFQNRRSCSFKYIISIATGHSQESSANPSMRIYEE